MRRLSTAGLVSVGAYLTLVVFFVAKAEYCFHNDGLFCLIGYTIPALPWILIFFAFGSMFPPESSPSTLGTIVPYAAHVLSYAINVLLIYRFGRFFANEVVRKNL